MLSLVYVSEATVAFTADDLERLAFEAARANELRGVTGYLYFQGHSFVQYLEGPEAAVEGLMGNIRVDDRHEVKRVIQQTLPGERRFPYWSMRQVTRVELMELDMEHLLADTLRLRTWWPTDPAWEASIWRMVNLLSRRASVHLNPE